MRNCTNSQHPIRGATFASGYAPEVGFCQTCYDQLPGDEGTFRRYLNDLRRAQAKQPATHDHLTRAQRLNAWLHFV
jgi:hypothetical protein